MITDRGVPFDPRQIGDVSAEAALTYLDSAQQMVRWDRQRGLATLRNLFRAGLLPDPALDGRYIGQLLALDIAPGLTRLAHALTARYMPWQGKSFTAANACGDNLFAGHARPLAALIWPLYRAYTPDRPGGYRAFPFRTDIGFGRQETDCTVMKIDYDLAVNPRLTVRRVLDELVELAPGVYLGQAHLRWWNGRWQLIAYFLLLESTLAQEWSAAHAR